MAQYGPAAFLFLLVWAAGSALSAEEDSGLPWLTSQWCSNAKPAFYFLGLASAFPLLGMIDDVGTAMMADIGLIAVGLGFGRAIRSAAGPASAIIAIILGIGANLALLATISIWLPPPR